MGVEERRRKGAGERGPGRGEEERHGERGDEEKESRRWRDGGAGRGGGEILI